MKFSSVQQASRSTRGFLAACALVLGFVGCVPDVLTTTPDMGADGGDPTALDPKSIFEAQAKPDLVASCQGCHALKQDIVDIFLARGSEYESITSYGMGKFITPNPDDSILLQKGQHTGPALTSGQYDDVHAWLEVEAATRTGLNMSSPATPSVAMGPGAFFISLEKLTGDPLSKLSFTVALKDNGATFDINNISLTTGPFTGLHVKHPIFLLFSLMGAQKDKGDSLSSVDVMVPASSSVDLGRVFLTQVPRFARMAMAFEAIDKVNPDPTKMVSCKAFDLFSSTVLPTLASPCAAVCHGTGAKNSAAASAMGAFDMTPAATMDMSKLGLFCLEALSRVQVTNPTQSVLVLQPTPPAMGGTPNHPYKLSDPAILTAFTTAVSNWAAKEK